MNSIEVSRNPGRQITNRLSWRKESLVMSGSDICGRKTWKWQLFLTLWLLRICGSVCLESRGNKCTDMGVAVVAFLKINLGEKKKKTSPHHSVSVTEWKQFTRGVKGPDLFGSISVQVNIAERLRFPPIPMGILVHLYLQHSFICERSVHFCCKTCIRVCVLSDSGFRYCHSFLLRSVWLWLMAARMYCRSLKAFYWLFYAHHKSKQKALSFSFIDNMPIICIHGNATVYPFRNIVSTLKITTLSPFLSCLSVIIFHSARSRSSGVHSRQRLWGEDHPEVERASADLRDHHSVRGETKTRVREMLRDIIYHSFEEPTDLFPISSCVLSPTSLWILCISFRSVFFSPQLW